MAVKLNQLFDFEDCFGSHGGIDCLPKFLEKAFSNVKI